MSSTKAALTRRQALAGLAGSAAVTLTAREAFAQAAPESLRQVLPTTNVCLLTPQAVEGPFYFDPKLERVDITEGRPGVPVRLLLQIIEAANCMPIEGARVDVWHADAVGRYSGYRGQSDDRNISTEGETFLRGAQMTDATGQAAFKTIYPGWYRGRTTHLHFKVLLDSKSLLTGQIYFPDALNEFIYTKIAPYDGRKFQRDTFNATDGVLKGSGGGHDSFCSIKEESDCYLASLVVGVDRDGAASKRMFGERGPFGSGGRPMDPPPPEPERPLHPEGLLIPGLIKPK